MRAIAICAVTLAACQAADDMCGTIQSVCITGREDSEVSPLLDESVIGPCLDTAAAGDESACHAAAERCLPECFTPMAGVNPDALRSCWHERTTGIELCFDGTSYHYGSDVTGTYEVTNTDDWLGHDGEVTLHDFAGPGTAACFRGTRSQIALFVTKWKPVACESLAPDDRLGSLISRWDLDEGNPNY